MLSDFLQLVRVAPDSSLLYTGHYNPTLVGLSLLAAFAASYAALLVARRAGRVTPAGARAGWLAAGGLLWGAGIWTMHFVGMLAFSLPCTTSYDPAITLLSMLPGVVASTLAITLISLPAPGWGRLILGGLLLGGGIGALHYTGMAAYRLDGFIRYDLTLFALSLVVAVLLAVLALWINFRAHRPDARWNGKCTLASALALGGAVSGMHYVAMAASYFVRDEQIVNTAASLSPEFLAAVVLSLTGALIVLTLVFLYVAQPLFDGMRRKLSLALILAAGWTAGAWYIADAFYAGIREEIAASGQPASVSSRPPIPGSVRLEAERLGSFVILALAGDMLILAVATLLLSARTTSQRAVEAGRGRDEIQRALAESEAAHRLLSEREAMLQAVFDSASVAIFRTDGEGRLRQANLRTTEMFHYAGDELLALNCVDLLAPEMREDIGLRFRAVGSGESRALKAECRLRRRDGSQFQGELAARPVLDESGHSIGIVGVVTDVTERHEAEQRVRYLAHHDPLTGLWNRASLLDRAGEALLLAKRHQRRLALLFIDLDRFKPINDLYGHDAGDAVLRCVAQRLHDAVRESDTVCRQGGDEFVILLPEISASTSLHGLAEKIRATVAESCEVDGRTLSVEASIGIATYPEHGDDLDTLIRSADAAMYTAKHRTSERIWMSE